MYGAMRYIGFSHLFLVFPSFIQCAALLLDLDKVTLMSRCSIILISRLMSVKYSEIGINEAQEFMNSILLEAVWKALFVYFYHARLTQACGVMAQLMLSATLWARSVELLTRMWRIHFLEMK